VGRGVLPGEARSWRALFDLHIHDRDVFILLLRPTAAVTSIGQREMPQDTLYTIPEGRSNGWPFSVAAREAAWDCPPPIRGIPDALP